MIEINNLTNFSVDKKFFIAVAKKVLKGENREGENISVAFVSPAEIKKLNKKYRKKNKSTNVLAFGENSLPTRDLPKGDKFQIPNSKLNSLGEIIICPEVVKKNGEKLEKMLVHGVLHVLGYDHEKSKKEAIQMEEKEKHYLSMII